MANPTALLAFWKNYDRKMYLRAAQLADDLAPGRHDDRMPIGAAAILMLAALGRRQDVGAGLDGPGA